VEQQRVVIVGGGVGGLAAALALADDGRAVTLLERDDLGPLADAEAAFAAERRGAPQVHQTHAFLARLNVLLRRRFPDVHAALLSAGGTMLPVNSDLGDPQPGDDDLGVLVVRRTTLEWVLRRAIAERAGVEVRTGVGVAGLAGTPAAPAVPARVTGVVLDDGTTLDADAVVVATGRRSGLPAWLEPLGVAVPEVVHESGLMYLTRWYRVPPDAAGSITDPRLAGDLRYLKYMGVPGDGGALSVTLSVRSADAELRTRLSDPDLFDRACRLVPGLSELFAATSPEPQGPVRPMGGLLNRIRRFVDAEGTPTVLGVHAVGDAHTCTNPLYGRGCSLAFVQAVELADAFAAHPGDPNARARAYEAASAREVEPWFDHSVQTDRMADPGPVEADGDPGANGTGGPGAEPDPDALSPAARGFAALFAAAAVEPVLGRPLAKLWNLLLTPAELASDPAFVARAAAVMSDPDAPIPPRAGPTRRELLAALTADPAPAGA
jgi:2-polyprenyl-6-methoxyphenol hydroxylase-like FAD-dependent oxidoreductase